jgi:RHS repeat-associated protein
VVSRFVYATQTTTPDYMVSGGVTYRIFSDSLGSPVLVVNGSTGAIAEQITYDEFGNVIADTNPAIQPFRFAGGLYDLDTKLLRFGARDYNPKLGRWTAKDPILFDGGEANLYGYVLEDPVNLTDATGLGGTKTRWVKSACDKCQQKKPKNPKPPRDPIRMPPIEVIGNTSLTVLPPMIIHLDEPDPVVLPPMIIHLDEDNVIRMPPIQCTAGK